MKKFFIGMTGIALCLCLTACGKSSNPSSVSGLSNQLDSTANALTSISTVSPTEINYNSDDKNDTLLKDSKLTQQTLLNEQYYKAEILNQTAIIKNKLNNVTLSKAQKAALSDLTNTLNKYTNSILNSKYEMNSSAKAISSMRKNASKNEEKLRAKYNRLACNSNMRSAYYENILNTLDEIENCLNLNCENCTQESTEQTKTVENQTTDDKSELEEEKTKPALKKNIDTYQNVDDTDEDLDYDTEFLPEQNYKRRRYNPNRNNTIYNRFERFNPSRNTDTYGPNRRNIDSFGGYGYNGYGMNGGFGYNNFGYNNFGGNMPYPNNGYGYGNNFYAGSNYGNRLNAPTLYANSENESEKENKAEKRLETFEKKSEDGSLEKISEEKPSQNCENKENCEHVETSAMPETGLRKLKNALKEEDQKVVAHESF